MLCASLILNGYKTKLRLWIFPKFSNILEEKKSNQFVEIFTISLAYNSQEKYFVFGDLYIIIQTDKPRAKQSQELRNNNKSWTIWQFPDMSVQNSETKPYQALGLHIFQAKSRFF